MVKITGKSLALDILGYVVRSGLSLDSRDFIREAVVAGAGRKEVFRVLAVARVRGGGDTMATDRVEANSVHLLNRCENPQKKPIVSPEGDPTKPLRGFTR